MKEINEFIYVNTKEILSIEPIYGDDDDVSQDYGNVTGTVISFKNTSRRTNVFGIKPADVIVRLRNSPSLGLDSVTF